MSMSKAVQESSRWCKRQSEPWKRGQNVSFESLSWQRNSKLHSIILVPANAKADDDVWCEARPFGVNSLANLMKRISEAAGLSEIYTCTNHNIRATATTLWSNGVVRSRHIMSNSHHRNEQSLAHCVLLFLRYISAVMCWGHFPAESRPVILRVSRLTKDLQVVISKPVRRRQQRQFRSSKNEQFTMCNLFSAPRKPGHSFSLRKSFSLAVRAQFCRLPNFNDNSNFVTLSVGIHKTNWQVSKCQRVRFPRLGVISLSRKLVEKLFQ